MVRAMRVCAFFFLVPFLGCQTNGPPKAEPEENITLEFQKDLADSLPPSLWSPQRRKVNASYFFLVAEYEALSGKKESANTFYDAAYALEPNPFLGVRMLSSMAAGGDLAIALMQARKLSLMYPQNYEILSLYGHLLLQNAAFDKAEKVFKKAISLNPSFMESYLGLVHLYQQKKAYEKAIATAKKMLDFNPGFANGWGLLAKLYLANDQKKKALKPAKKAYNQQPTDAESILIYALSLELNGKSKKAVALYEKLFRMDGANEELISRLVGLYRQIGDLDEALELLTEAMRKNPHDAILLQKAYILWEKKEFARASKILKGIAKRNPDSNKYKYMAGLSLEKVRDLPAAAEYYKSIEQGSSLYLGGRYRAIMILRSLKQYEKALGLLLDVLKQQNDDNAHFYSLGAHIYSDLSREKDGVALLEKGYLAHPGKIELLFLQGVYLEKQGEIEACIEVMRRVIEKNKTHHGALNFLGYLYAERGKNLDEAESLIKRALEQQPLNGFYKDSLGWVYYQKKQYDKAKELLYEALKLSPQEGVIFEHVGDVYLAKGDRKKALGYFKKALELRLSDKDKARILKKLDELNA